MSERRAEAGGVADRGAARDQWQGDGRHGHTENTERQLHQAKSDVEPAHRSVTESRRESAVDQHIYLHRAGRDRGRPHQRENDSHTGIAPIEVGTEFETHAPERRQLNDQLQKPADQSSDGQTDQATLTEMRMTPIGLRIDPIAKRNAPDDRPEVEKTRSHRRHAENMLGIKHNNLANWRSGWENEGPHDSREQNRDGGFFRGEANGIASRNSRRGSPLSKQRDRAHENDRQ